MKKTAIIAGISLAAIGFSAASTAQQDYQMGQWYLGGNVSHMYHDSKRDPFGGGFESTQIGARAGVVLNDFQSLEASYQYGLNSDSLEHYGIHLINRFNRAQFAGFTPYLAVGVSVTDFKDRVVDENHTPQIDAGLGLARMLDERVEFRTEVRTHYAVDNDAWDASFHLGLNYHFGSRYAAAPVAAEPAPVAAEPAEPDVRTITVRINVEFEFDKAVVRNIYGDELEAVANAMKAHDDIDLVLEGHTDSVGAESYNQDLSERRAAAVKAKLSEDYGIPAERIRAVGYGETRPIASNDTDEGRQRNRRVVGELSYKEVVPR